MKPNSIQLAAIPLVLGLACTNGSHEHGIGAETSNPEGATISTSSPPTVPTASATTSAASGLLGSVPCGIPAPLPPMPAKDSQTFTLLLKTSRRIDVLGVEGRLLFAGTSRAVTHYGPSNEYVNRIHELKDNTIRPSAELNRGIWIDFHLWGAWGHWPDTLVMVGDHYGNTSWENGGFRWDTSKGEWEDWDFSSPEIQWGWGSPWESTKNATGSKRSVSATSPVGIPKDLCDGVASCATLEVVAPRDLYTTTAGCERGWDRKCAVTRILHWCAPRTYFEESKAPKAIPNAHIMAVPGMALVWSGQNEDAPMSTADAPSPPPPKTNFDYGWTFRDGVWAPVKSPEAPFHKNWLVASGGSIWYLGSEGLYRLGEGGFERVSAWRREYGSEVIGFGLSNIMGRSKLTLPGTDGPAAITGFMARTPEELWLTTWDGKETRIWSTSPQKLSLGN